MFFWRNKYRLINFVIAVLLVVFVYRDFSAFETKRAEVRLLIEQEGFQNVVRKGLLTIDELHEYY